jgi:hypothetical protein
MCESEFFSKVITDWTAGFLLLVVVLQMEIDSGIYQDCYRISKGAKAAGM